MDPFTEVRDDPAGAVNHDPPRTPARAGCQPRGPPAGRIARARRERAGGRKPRGRSLPGSAARRLELWLFQGKAGKTGPQNPTLSPELYVAEAGLPPPPEGWHWVRAPDCSSLTLPFGSLGLKAPFPPLP